MKQATCQKNNDFTQGKASTLSQAQQYSGSHGLARSGNAQLDFWDEERTSAEGTLLSCEAGASGTWKRSAHCSRLGRAMQPCGEMHVCDRLSTHILWFLDGKPLSCLAIQRELKHFPSPLVKYAVP